MDYTTDNNILIVPIGCLKINIIIYFCTYIKASCGTKVNISYTILFIFSNNI